MSKIEFDVVRSYDPEVFRAVKDPKVVGRYLVDRDLSRLGLPDDAKPITFRCRALTRSQRDHVRAVSNDDARAILCFRYGVLEIRNIPEGGAHRSWSPERNSQGDPLSDDALDALEAKGIGDNDLVEIGVAIEGLSFLAHGVPPSCRLPRSSQRAWGVQEASRSRAEQKPEPATPEGNS